MTVYSLVEVTFDHFRFEKFHTVFNTEDEARKYAERFHPQLGIIVSDNSLGSDEYDDFDNHWWIKPIKLN